MTQTTLAPPSHSPVTQTVSRCPNCDASGRERLFTSHGYRLVRCHSCQLVFIENPPSADELQRMYSFETNYHQEFQHSSVLRQQFLNRGRVYLRYLQRHQSPARLLDVGCSAGFFLSVARDAGWDVTGLEFSRDSANLGRELHSLPIHQGSLSQHELEPESFDAITLWDVIEHLPDPLQEMREARELLKPGGMVAISTPDIDGLFPRMSYLVADRIGFWRHPEPPGHLFQFSKRTLANLLTRAGFEIVQAYPRRIPLDYSFGTPRELLRMPKRLAYAGVFAPLALVGPWLGMGDEVVMIARRPRETT